MRRLASMAVCAALALPVLRLACALHGKMATFDEAKISGPAP